MNTCLSQCWLPGVVESPGNPPQGSSSLKCDHNPLPVLQSFLIGPEKPKAAVYTYLIQTAYILSHPKSKVLLYPYVHSFLVLCQIPFQRDYKLSGRCSLCCKSRELGEVNEWSSPATVDFSHSHFPKCECHLKTALPVLVFSTSSVHEQKIRKSEKVSMTA